MRLLCKTVTYGMIHLVVATSVAYMFVGNFQLALGIGVVEPLVQTVVFALHDYVWERDRKGKDGHEKVVRHHGHVHFGKVNAS